MGTAYQVLVLLHIVAVVGGFGAVAYNGLYATLAARRPAGGTSAVLEINRLVSGLAEALIYAAVLFGIGAVAASHKRIGFGDAWVSAALGVYVALLAILHGWIRPRSRRYSEVVGALETPGPPGPERDGAVGRLRALERRVNAGWAAFDVLLVGAVYLMVFKPGG